MRDLRRCVCIHHPSLTTVYLEHVLEKVTKKPQSLTLLTSSPYVVFFLNLGIQTEVIMYFSFSSFNHVKYTNTFLISTCAEIDKWRQIIFIILLHKHPSRFAISSIQHLTSVSNSLMKWFQDRHEANHVSQTLSLGSSFWVYVSSGKQNTRFLQIFPKGHFGYLLSLSILYAIMSK